MASVALYGVVSLIALLSSTKYGVSDVSNYTRICSGVSAPLFPEWYALYHATFVAAVSLLSVFIYVAVFIAYQSAMRKAVKTMSTVAETQQQANQRRLTITIGIITVSSVVLFIAPMTLNAITIWMNVRTPGRTFITPMLQANAILNTVIYIVRQSEIRAAMWKVLTCGVRSGDMNEGNNVQVLTPTARFRLNQRAR
jgi:ABC-type Fe3+ transport system permease subunit